MRGGSIGLVEGILVVLALASLIAARRYMAEAWRPGTRLQAAAAQVLVTGGMLMAASFVENQRLVQLVVTSGFAAVLIFAELSDIRSRRRNSTAVPFMPNNNTPIVLILVTWLWLFAVNLWFVPVEATEQAIYRIFSGLILFIFVVTQRYRPISIMQFYSAALITISVSMIMLPLLPRAFIACGTFKCNSFNAILLGPFGSGNLLALAAAMCAALLLASTTLSARSLLVLVFLTVILYLTMARTSLWALGAAAGLFAVDRLLTRKHRQHGVSEPVAKFAAACIAVFPMGIGMWLVFNSSYEAFSNRGKTWTLGREVVAGHALTGRGLEWWNVLEDLGYFGSRFKPFAHSEYLLIYFSGGVIGLALFGIMLYRVTCMAIFAQNSLARGAVISLTFALSGVLEANWNPLTVDAGTWLFFGLVASCVAFEPAPHRSHLSPPQVQLL